MRTAAAALVAGLLLAGCTAGGDPDPSSRGASSGSRTHQAHQAQQGPLGPAGRPGCRGVTRGRVRGPEISYAEGPLATTPVSGAVCAAYWLPGADRGLVPQGLALDRHTAWVGGYRLDRRTGTRRCEVVRISLRTGERLTGTDDLPGCHHGGGLALTPEGLWLTGTVRLWLLDPALVGTGRDPVRRSWRLVDPLRGSTLTGGGARLGLGRFDKRGHPSDVAWFDRGRVLAPGVAALTTGRPRDGRDRPVGPVATSRGLLWLQGVASRPGGGLWLAQSVTRCGALRLPGGRRVAFLPGAEGLAFDRRGDLWALSESGARPYQRDGTRPLVPQLVRLDTDALGRAPRPGCQL